MPLCNSAAPIGRHGNQTHIVWHDHSLLHRPIDELYQAAASSLGISALGPMTGSSLVQTFIQHIVCSAAGGLVMLVIWWIIHKIKSRIVNHAGTR